MATGTLVDILDDTNSDQALDLGIDAIVGWGSAIYSVIKFLIAFIFNPIVLGVIVAVLVLMAVGYKIYRKLSTKVSGSMPK